jgi:hypothetical protein
MFPRAARVVIPDQNSVDRLRGAGDITSTSDEDSKAKPRPYSEVKGRKKDVLLIPVAAVVEVRAFV